MTTRPPPSPSRNPSTLVHSRFCAGASEYDGYANIQKKVAAQLMRFITTSPRHVLEIGCGSGQLTSILIDALQDAHIEAIDISQPMIAEASRRSPPNARLNWQVADFMTFSSKREFDLIASASALHWIYPIESAFHRIRGLLAPHGRFIFAIMVDGTLHELRDARLRISPSKPPRGNLPRGSEVRQAAARAGLEIIECRDDQLVEFFYSSETFLHAIHTVGVTGGDVSRSHIPLTRGEISRLIDDYDAHYSDQDSRVVATYDVLYMHARRDSTQ